MAFEIFSSEKLCKVGSVVPGIYHNIKVPISFNLMFSCFKYIKDISVHCYYLSLSQVFSIFSIYSNKTVRFFFKNVVVYSRPMQSVMTLLTLPFSIKQEMHQNIFSSTIISNLYFTSFSLMKCYHFARAKLQSILKFHYSNYKVKFQQATGMAPLHLSNLQFN